MSIASKLRRNCALMSTRPSWVSGSAISAMSAQCPVCPKAGPTVDMMPTGSEHSRSAWRSGEHPTTTVFVPRAQPDRAVLNKIKQCRRLATRYDKLAANYLAFIQLASIRLWLRVYETTPSLRENPMLISGDSPIVCQKRCYEDGQC